MTEAVDSMRTTHTPRFVGHSNSPKCPRLYGWLNPKPIVGPPVSDPRGHIVAKGRADMRPIVVWCAGAIIFLAAAAITIDTHIRYKPNPSLPGAHRYQHPLGIDFGFVIVLAFLLSAGLAFAWFALIAASTRIRLHADLATNQLHITQTRLGKASSSTAQLRRCTLMLTPHSEFIPGRPGTTIQIFALLLTPPNAQPIALFASRSQSAQCAKQSVSVAKSWMRCLQLDCAITPDEELHAASRQVAPIVSP